MSKIIWSKGLRFKDEYALNHTGYLSNHYEIKQQLKKDIDKVWIRNNNHDLYLLKDILDRPVTIYLSDGDYTFPDDYDQMSVTELLNNVYVIKIYAQNYNSYKKLIKVFNYPIGLDLHTREWFIGDYNWEKVKYMMSIRDKKDKYMCAFCDCHLTYNRSPDRYELYKIQNRIINKIDKRISCKDVLDEYASHHFVISAHGGGLDCHRTWEALLCGAIVIHKHSPLDPLFIDLPVVLIHDYKEITEVNLNNWYMKYKNKCNIGNILSKLNYEKYS